MHYWIVEHNIVEHRTNEHRDERNKINDKLIGTLVEVPVVVVQGVEIKRPSWFRETEVDIDQLMQGRRRPR